MLTQSPGIYGTFLCLGGLVGACVALYCGRRQGIAGKRLLASQVLMAIAGAGGAKLFGVVARGDALSSVLDSAGVGYRYPGAVLSIGALVWVIGRITAIGPGVLLDLGGAAFGFSLAVIRIGCLLAGCCAGKVCHLPWAITYPQGSSLWGAHVRDGLIARDATAALPAHPLPIYFGLWSLSIGVFLLWFFPRKKFDGQIFLMYVALQGIGKFFLEFLRYRPSLEVQYPSLLLGLIAAAILFAKLPAGRKSGEAPSNHNPLDLVEREPV